MAKMTKAELVTLVRQEIEQAEGFDSDELASNREKALNYYYARPRGDEMSGRSSVQSTDVADMLEAVVAQIMPALEIDDVAAFEPESADDVDQAGTESDAVNNVIMESNRGYVVFQSAIRDALLMRNGWVKVWVDEQEEATTHTFEDIEVIAGHELVNAGADDPNLDIEIVSQDIRGSKMDLTIRLTQFDRNLRVDSIDPTLMLFSENHDSIFLDGIRFVAERDFPTRTELILEGFPKNQVKKLKAITLDTKNDSQARNRNGERGREAHESSQDVLERYTCYLLVDFDGDGIGERREIQIVEREILLNEPTEYIPYATGTPFMQPHRLNGLSLFDKLEQIQDVKTATLRNYLDNMSANNNGRMKYRRGAVDLDHATNSRPGGLIECLDPQTDLIPIPVLDTGASNLALLEYTDKMRSERGGASLDLQGAELQIAGETAHGIERQFSSREQLAAMMSRNLAETLLRSAYLKTHQALRLFMPGQLKFRRRGADVATDPGEWNPRTRLNIKTGLSQGERGRMISSLSAVVNEHKQLAQMGLEGILFTRSQTHAAYMDMSRAAGVDNPERYWTNPESEEAQQASQQQIQQQEAAAQAQQEATDKLLAVQVQIQEGQNEVRAMGDRLDALVAVLKIQFDKESKEAELTVGAVGELAKLSLAGGNESEQ